MSVKMKNMRIDYDFSDWDNLKIKKDLVKKEEDQIYKITSPGRMSENQNPQDSSLIGSR